MIKHRKLYPTSDNNSTLPCPDICDSSCPYGCDPYADGYLLPPPAPPPPAQDSHSILSKPNGHLSPLVIVLVTLFSSCFFAVIFYLLAVKFRPRWNFFRRRQRQTPEDTNEEFLDQNHGPTAIDYPIWYINTIGLQPSVIESITIFRYKKGESLIEGTECSVCLNEFQNDETLRLLPKCSHAFHIPCIDTWLRSHINCPVCRAGIVSTTATSIPVVSNALNTNNLGANEDSQSENTEFGDIINVNIRAGEDGFCENRTDTGEITEAQLVDPDVQDVQIVKFNLIHKETSDSPVLEDSDNEDYDEKPMRKCVSVDSLLKVSVCLSESEDNSGSEDQIPGEVSSKKVCGNLKTVRNSDGNYLITQHLHKRPVQMKRSFSYSGRSTLLSSRQYSRTKSSVSSSNPRD